MESLILPTIHPSHHVMKPSILPVRSRVQQVPAGEPADRMPSPRTELPQHTAIVYNGKTTPSDGLVVARPSTEVRLR